MKTLIKYQTISALVMAVTLGGTVIESSALTLPNPLTNAYQYGDFYSYSLPILAYQYSQVNGGGVGPGNPYYIASSPGQIASSIVLATGNKESNFTGMDNAYLTPSGKSGSTAFSTGTSPDPGQLGTVTGNQSGTWDSTIAAFKSVLNGVSPIFLFNNNDTSKAQDLDAWARVTVRSSTNSVPSQSFDFTNNGGLGGIPGGDVFAYNSPAPTEPTDADYVFSGGEVTLPIGPNGANVTFEHNLGANQAAYAIVSPELNNFLMNWSSTSKYDLLSIDLRLKNIDNGYEQLFIVPNDYTAPVPEPGTMVLLGAGLVMMSFYIKRRRQ